MNIKEKTDTIEFFIDSSRYHYNILEHTLSVGNKPEVDETGLQKIVGNGGFEFRLPVTIFYKKGFAVELYEFYSFISSVMASINGMVDLKCRIVDGYNEERSFSFGQYMNKKAREKLPDFQDSLIHELILQNSEWIDEIKEARNTIQHKPIQTFFQANLVFKAQIEGQEQFNDESHVKMFVPLMHEEPKEVVQFCSDVLVKLEQLWQVFKDEIPSCQESTNNS
ncbi:hypothetical protein [uncultured Methanolobus sp.]|uniref:hypothetical protein n=1 Tax=uncultured Methanolobus sp. TaxID=218300 RepID=UPI002AAB30D7|nr:hypothetical protein [uncultured Methanolobus sp.]